MLIRFLAAGFFAALAGLVPASADEAGTERFALGGDEYAAGQSVTYEGPGPVRDLFLAGEAVRVAAEVDGSAHLAGRRVAVAAPVGGNLYGAAFDIVLEAPVSGAATLFAYRVDVAGAVEGNLRVGGSEVRVTAPVGGAMLLSGERLFLDAPVAGDAAVLGREVTYGDAARVDGMLTVFAEEPDEVSVPERVAPAERVQVRPLEAFEDMREEFPGVAPGPRQVVGGFALGILAVALTAMLVLALAPGLVRSWRELAMARPWRALGSGFLVTSALVGSAVVLSFTLIGILLVPAVFVLTCLSLYAGYVLGAYVLGAGIWRAAGAELPQGLAGKAAMAAVGATLGGLAWLVPVLGWLFAVGLTLLGVGVLFAWIVPRDPLLHRPAG